MASNKDLTEIERIFNLVLNVLIEPAKIRRIEKQINNFGDEESILFIVELTDPAIGYLYFRSRYEFIKYMIKENFFIQSITHTITKQLAKVNRKCRKYKLRTQPYDANFEAGNCVYKVVTDEKAHTVSPAQFEAFSIVYFRLEDSGMFI